MKYLTPLPYLRLLLAGCTLTLLMPSLLSLTSAQTNSFDRKAMLENIAFKVILPCFETFAQKAEKFELATTSLVTTPNTDTLETAQTAWQEAGYAWAQCEPYAFGGLEIMILHNQIDKTPINTSQIESFINADEKIDEAFIDSKGSTARGLGAAEYLLFNTEDAAILETLQDQRRLQYLAALATNITAKANGLILFWSPEGENYAATFAAADSADGSVKGSVNRLMNELIATLEGLAREKLAEPLGDLDGSEPRPELAESFRSQTSLDRIKGNLLGAQHLFTGTDSVGAEGLGIDDYLDFLGANSLSGQIDNLLLATLEASEGIDEPLETALANQPESVRQIYSVLQNLLVLTSVDAANQLGVTVTFNDSDGD